MWKLKVLVSLFVISVSLLLSVPNVLGAAISKEQMINLAMEAEIQYNLPSGIVVAVCEQETRWRNVPGAAGEIGVCQIKPSTVNMINQGNPYADAQTLYFKGTAGPTIERIQTVLASQRDLIVDGIFGNATLAGVRDYQKLNRLRVDGIVGPRTWAVMFPGEPFPGKTVVQALWNPQENIDWAARYLSWCAKNVSPEPLALMACYNGGAGHPLIRYMMSVKDRMANARANLFDGSSSIANHRKAYCEATAEPAL